MTFETEGTISIDFLKSKIQNIINKEFKDSRKRTIKSFPDRLNFACPLCGDSGKIATKKRGNLYLKNVRIKCFNCGESMPFTKFCDKFQEKIEMDDRIKLYNYVDNIKYTKTDDYTLELLDKLIPIEKFVEYFNNHPKSWLTNISKVQPNSPVYQYLKYERLLNNFEDFYQGVYNVWRFKTNVMISLNRCDDKILGIQLRNLERDRKKRFYKIVEFEEIYNFMNPADYLDELDAISYNKLSHFFNILNVNFEESVTIFEGFIDTKFYNNGYNTIGLVGASHDKDLLNFLTESDEDLDLKFFYDNDSTGINKAQKMLKKGYPVFLWNKLFEKLLENKSNKYEAKNRLIGIVDLNDLVKNAKDPNIYEKLKLDNYFSKDEFDLLYLDKIIFDKETKTWSKKS